MIGNNLGGTTSFAELPRQNSQSALGQEIQSNLIEKKFSPRKKTLGRTLSLQALLKPN